MTVTEPCTTFSPMEAQAGLLEGIEARGAKPELETQSMSNTLQDSQWVTTCL